MPVGRPKPRTIHGNPARKLTLKEERFCAAYIKDFSAIEAGKEAGYSETNSFYKLADAAVQRRIQELQKQITDKAVDTAVDVLRETQFIAMGDLVDFLACPTVEKLQALAPEKRRLIKSIKMGVLKGGEDKQGRKLPDEAFIEKIELWSREWALKLLGERDQTFTLPVQPHVHMTVDEVNSGDAQDAYQRLIGRI